MDGRCRNRITFLYIMLALAEFSRSVIYLVRRFVYDDYDYGSELCISFAKSLLHLLPLIAFILISKKMTENGSLQKNMRARKFVGIYLASVLVFGAADYVFAEVCGLRFPVFPLCFFHTCSWLFSLKNLIQFHSFSSAVSLALDAAFWIVSIMFMKSLGKGMTPEEEFREGTGKTSAGYKLGIAAVIILSVQTALNICLAGIMHENLSGVSGEHAVGAAVFAFILIAVKLFLDLILLPAIPLSIAGIVKCSSKKEIAQERKNRLLGKKINIICLVIAVLELVLVW